jgi:hypothetical protein
VHRHRAIAVLVALAVGCGTLQPSPDDDTDGGSPPPGVDAGDDASEAGTRGAAYAKLVVDDGPLAYFRLDDLPGSAGARDEIGKLAGPHPFSAGCMLGADGVVPGDKAVYFDGAKCRIDVGDPVGWLDFSGNKPFTVEAWARSDGGTFQHVFTREQRTDHPLAGYALLLENATTVYAERASSATVNDLTQPATVATGAFVHLVLTFDGQTIRLYVDGQPQGPGTESTAPVPDVAIAPLIGAAAPTENLFHGIIDEVAIYGRVLPPDRIDAHHRAFSGP